MQVKFKNPPINEVIIGVYFDPGLAALRSEHIGMFWSRLKQEFPTVEQRFPITNPIQSNQAVIEISNEIMPMPRYWLVSEDEATLVQIQKDAFLLNWRRRESDYPHFDENLKPSFDKYYGIFESFLKDDVGVESPRIGHCELTYIDMIEPSEYWKGPLDTSDLIQPFSIPQCASTNDAVPVFNCAYLYHVNPNLQLHVAVRSATSVEQPDSPLLYLEFKGLGSPLGNTKPDTDEWYDLAHKVIVEQFLSMTNKQVQREHWIREDIG